MTVLGGNSRDRDADAEGSRSAQGSTSVSRGVTSVEAQRGNKREGREKHNVLRQTELSLLHQNSTPQFELQPPIGGVFYEFTHCP